MHSWTTRQLLGAMPCGVVLAIFVVGCGRTEREFQAGPSNQPPDYRPIPVGTGSGGDDGTGSGGAESSQGGDGMGGAGDDESGSEPGAAGQPASGTEPETDPGPGM